MKLAQLQEARYAMSHPVIDWVKQTIANPPPDPHEPGHWSAQYKIKNPTRGKNVHQVIGALISEFGPPDRVETYSDPDSGITQQLLDNARESFIIEWTLEQADPIGIDMWVERSHGQTQVVLTTTEMPDYPML